MSVKTGSSASVRMTVVRKPWLCGPGRIFRTLSLISRGAPASSTLWHWRHWHWMANSPKKIIIPTKSIRVVARSNAPSEREHKNVASSERAHISSAGTSAIVDDDEWRAVVALTCALRSRLHVATDPIEQCALEQLMQTPEWMRCFVRRNEDVQAATKAALLYTSYAPSGTKPASAVEAMPWLSVGDAHLVELLAAPDSTGRPIGLVRDVSMLSTLLSRGSFDQIAAAHLWRLKELLTSSVSAQQRGVTLIQNLSQLSAKLQLQLLEPRTMVAQARIMRYIFSCFPIRWGTLIVIDAPSVFAPVWRAVKEFLPEYVVQSVQFLKSPCSAELVALVGEAAAAEIGGVASIT